MAAVAGPDGSFGAARQISPLGTTTGQTLAVAISDRGERLVAWQESEAGAAPEGAMSLSLGDDTPDGPVSPDRRRPRLAVALSLARLRAAAAGAVLRWASAAARRVAYA